MAEKPPKPESSIEDLWLAWLKPRRWIQFFRRVLTVESSLVSLKAENTGLQGQVRQLDAEVKELQAVLRVLVPTLNGMIDDKVRIALLETVPSLVEREIKRLGKSGGKL